jgi:hypothetical protein
MGKNSVGHWPLAGIQLHQSMSYMSFDKTPKGAGQITVLIPATNNPIKSFMLVRNDCPNVGGIAKSGHRIAIGEVIHLN